MITAAMIIVPVGSRRLPVAKAWGLQNECWPDDLLTDTTANGPAPNTNATGGLSAYVEFAEDYLTTTEFDLGFGYLTISEFSAITRDVNSITKSGSMQGLLIATIHWDNPSMDDTTFTSGCAAEVQTHQENPDPIDCSSDTLLPPSTFARDLEVEMEGSVQNFPGYSNTAKAAVATLGVTPDGDHHCMFQVKLTIGLGYTCNETFPPGFGTVGGDDIEIAATAHNIDPSTWNIDNVTSGLIKNPPLSSGFCSEGD
jgi:hypothetical protein